MKKILIVICSSVVIVMALVLAGMFNSTDEVVTSGTVILDVTHQMWTGWSEKQPNPDEESREIQKGDVLELESESFSSCKVKATIEDIKEDAVVVHFHTESVVKSNADGSIDLNSNDYDWIDEIKYNEEYRLSSQTLDAGIIWKLVFNK